MFFRTERIDPLDAAYTPASFIRNINGKEVNVLFKVKRLVSIGIVLGVLAFPTSSFASNGNSANHQSQTQSSIYEFFSSCFGNKGGGNNGNHGNNGGWNWNDCWDWGKWSDWCGGKDGHDHDHDGGDCPDSFDIWQNWYCN
jgi:hypothetical protein